MAKTSYSEKLRDPRWQKVRLKIFERDKFACVICGDTEASLQVHHKEYKFGKEPWDYEYHLLQTFCEHCHTAISEITKDSGLPKFFDALKIRKDGSVYLFVYYDGWFKIIPPESVSQVTLQPNTLKKIIHFITNNWLRDE